MTWLNVHRGDAPMVIAFPHGGNDLAGLDAQFVSPWLARRDADWWIAELYAFARDLGVTTVATTISRSVIDCNRDPSGASLYPGAATTELVPTTTFDGEPLYASALPDATAIVERRSAYFDPYHAALTAEVERLRAQHPRVVVYDAHSIRSHIPRLFEGELPQFNIGTNSGASCDLALTAAIAAPCAASGFGHVVNGRFKGGWTTRHHGQPERGIHAVQMELALRGYVAEPASIDSTNWPAPLADAPVIAPTLRSVIDAALAFAKSGEPA